ncbi:MAG: anti-sigma factor [Acidimicrobiia bacterium]|nr:anti-sigma factor [Acidimicrobiia bacterium]
MDEHREVREWAAAYVLGALDPEDRRRFESHLKTCSDCAEAVTRFTALPGLLKLVERPEPEPAPDRILDSAAAMLDSEWSAVLRSRRRWRWAALVAAAAAGIALVSPLIGPADEDGRTVIAVEADSPIEGTVALESKPWGTAVEIVLEALPQSDRYVAWAVSAAGDWEQVAAWGPTPNLSARVAGASSIATGDLAAVVITTGDRSRTIATANLPT